MKKINPLQKRNGLLELMQEVRTTLQEHLTGAIMSIQRNLEFSNTEAGFVIFKAQMEGIVEKQGKEVVIPEMIYAEIQSLSNLRLQTLEEITRIRNRIVRWFSIYFPKIKDVYKKLDSVSDFIILKAISLPKDIVK